MKITYPATVREEVGQRFSYAGSETVYYAGEQPSRSDLKLKTTPVYETRVVTKVAFDRDLKLKTRLLGAAYLTLIPVLTVGLGAAAVGVLAFHVIRDATVSAYERLQYGGGVLGDFGAFVADEVRSAVSEIVNP